MDMGLKCILAVGFQPEEETIIQTQWFRSGLRVPLRFTSDGKVALELIPRATQFYERPDLVILKLRDKPDSGWEFLASMRKQRKYREVLMVVCGENLSDDAIERAYAIGADCWVDESSDFRQLFQLLHRVERFWFDPPLKMVA